MTIQNADFSENWKGGLILSFDAIQVANTTVSGNEFHGFSINSGQTATILQSEFSSNGLYGLDLAYLTEAVTVADSDFSGNGIYVPSDFSTGDRYGLGIQSMTCPVSVSGVAANNNFINGMKVFKGAGLTVTDSTFSGNSGAGFLGSNVFGGVALVNVEASNNGGRGTNINGNATAGAGVEIQGGIFQANQGGGLRLNNTTGVTISGVQVVDNGATQAGGGIAFFGQLATNVTISDSTVAGNSTPSAGGGIHVGPLGSYAIMNSQITGNTAQGRGGGINLNTSGAVLIDNSVIAGNEAVSDGGGISVENLGETVIQNSSITGNAAAGYGGGIAQVGGTVTIIGSTLAGNWAADGGGGIRHLDTGITAPNPSGVTNVQNSTISGNTTAGQGGGIWMGYGTLNVDSSTITQNSAADSGGGITRLGTQTVGVARIGNTIIAGNQAIGLPFTADVSGYFSSQGYNLVGLASPNAGFDGLGDLTGPETGPAIDPVLGPLADNGGPTLTHALLAGSPAIDAGMTSLAVDQRGRARPADGNGDQTAAADIGAFEIYIPVANDDFYAIDEDGTLVVEAEVTSVSGLVLRYGFDESTSGAQDAVDSGGSPAANGTFAGQATRTDSTPAEASDGALDLTGGTDAINYVSAGDVDKVDALDEMTLTLWINLQADPQNGDQLVSKRQLTAPADTVGWEFVIKSVSPDVNPTAADFTLYFGEWSLHGTGSDGNGMFVPGFGADHQWVFLAVTVDKHTNLTGVFDKTTMYQGGIDAAVAQRSSSGLLPSRLGGDNQADLRIGGTDKAPDVDCTPPAWIDDVRIYDHPLSLAELEVVRQEGVTQVSALGVLLNDSDPDGDPLSAVLVDGPQNGNLSLAPDGSFVYAPDLDFNGTDTFTYRASDGELESGIATVTITVAPVNDAPLAGDDDASTAEDTSVVIAVLSNDSDVDGDGLAVIAVGDPDHGTVEINPQGTVTYTPAADFNGADAFSYTISDGDAGTATATVTVTVTPVNDAPAVETLSLSGDPGPAIVEGQPVRLDASFFDVDLGDTHTATIDWGDGQTSPGAIDETAQTVAASHVYADAGFYTVTLTVTDAAGASDSQSIVAVVAGISLDAGTLTIVGTEGADDVSVAQGKKGMLVIESPSILPGGAFSIKASDIARVVAYLMAGDDQFAIDSRVAVPAIVHGGEGADLLASGGGPAVLLGDEGDDVLVGGSARDILIGGLGADRIDGGRDQDILVDGTTSFDGNDLALLAILEEWTSSRSYNNRVANISAGSGPILEGTGWRLEAGATVSSDGDPDQLVRSAGKDWFFYDPAEDYATAYTQKGK